MGPHFLGTTGTAMSSGLDVRVTRVRLYIKPDLDPPIYLCSSFWYGFWVRTLAGAASQKHYIRDGGSG